ncbi:MAG: YceI family protein [Acidobacteria bacterium]|nr:YceI family protein [Acidobacteriota bacterium]
MIWSQFGVDANNLNIVEKFAAQANVSQDNTAGTYSFDKNHSAIGFRIKHMGLVDVPGYFRDFTGTVNYDPKDIAKSSVEFTAQMTSVDTGVAGRDKHLRTADFFKVEKFPTMTFKSTKVEKKGKNMLVTGDLTMKGVTKQVSFPFEIAGFLTDAKGGTKMGVTAETVINRRDFGVNYGNTLPNGVAALGDEVKVNLQIEAAMNKKP